MADFKTYIGKAIQLHGSQAKLAKAAGCSQQLISQIHQGKTGVSAEMALAFEKATEGAISRHELRPDIFGGAA